MKASRSEIQQTIDAIRKEWMSYRRKHAAIQKRAERIQLPDGRWKTLIRCCSCSGLFPREDIEADHINPVGPLLSTKPEDVAAYRQRMFCRTSEIAPRCKPCHRSKTTMDRIKQKETKTCTSAHDTSLPFIIGKTSQIDQFAASSN